MSQTFEKIYSRQEMAAAAAVWKGNGQKVVFTNGCFDVLHLGHLDYLEKARTLGDKLIIGLNSDDSVRKLKGENRPVNDVLTRTRMLAALQFVDGVVVFSEETPYELIKLILPDILVKGNDYLAANIVGADIVMNNGGEVKTLPFIEGYSTSLIIEKIRNG